MKFKNLLLAILLVLTTISLFSQNKVQQIYPCKDDSGATIAGCQAVSLAGGRYAEVVIDTSYCVGVDEIIRYNSVKTQHGFAQGDFVYADVIRGGCPNSTEGLWTQVGDTTTNTLVHAYTDSLWILNAANSCTEFSSVLDTLAHDYNSLLGQVQNENQNFDVSTLQALDGNYVDLASYSAPPALYSIGLDFFNCNCTFDSLKLIVDYTCNSVGSGGGLAFPISIDGNLYIDPNTGFFGLPVTDGIGCTGTTNIEYAIPVSGTTQGVEIGMVWNEMNGYVDKVELQAFGLSCNDQVAFISPEGLIYPGYLNVQDKDNQTLSIDNIQYTDPYDPNQPTFADLEILNGNNISLSPLMYNTDRQSIRLDSTSFDGLKYYYGVYDYLGNSQSSFEIPLSPNIYIQDGQVLENDRTITFTSNVGNETPSINWHNVDTFEMSVQEGFYVGQNINPASPGYSYMYAKAGAGFNSGDANQYLYLHNMPLRWNADQKLALSSIFGMPSDLPPTLDIDLTYNGIVNTNPHPANLAYGEFRIVNRTDNNADGILNLSAPGSTVEPDIYLREGQSILLQSTGTSYQAVAEYDPSNDWVHNQEQQIGTYKIGGQMFVQKQLVVEDAQGLTNIVGSTTTLSLPTTIPQANLISVEVVYNEAGTTSYRMDLDKYATIEVNSNDITITRTELSNGINIVRYRVIWYERF